jgi:hypothetical protein
VPDTFNDLRYVATIFVLSSLVGRERRFVAGKKPTFQHTNHMAVGVAR